MFGRFNISKLVTATLIATLFPVLANVGLQAAHSDGNKEYQGTQTAKPAPAAKPTKKKTSTKKSK